MSSIKPPDLSPAGIPLIHQLFEEQVKKSPEAIAVVWEGQSLSYQELNERANQCAHYLQQLGVKTDVIVGILLEHSLDLIVCLMAVFKAGCVYLPLDPSYSSERLNFILEDSHCSLLITHHNLHENFINVSLNLIELETRSPIEEQPITNLETLNQEEDLAYIIYTSGSTGVPKGVLIEQRSLSLHCQTIIEHFQLGDRDRVFQFASPSFDVSLEQILPTLIIGATLILRPRELLTGLAFHRQLSNLELTVVNLPPAYWIQWVQAVVKNPSPLPHLRLVICGGEAIPLQGLKDWRKSCLNSIRLLNAYGPTETTITATTYSNLRSKAAQI